jgi:putative restriction endonuclease
MAGVDIPMESTAPVSDFPLADPIEAAIETEEGRRFLREHIATERPANLVRRFKRALRDASCVVCGFNFEKMYGELGRDFIEAHHIRPVAAMQPGETTRIADLVAVCSNCHRMLHKQSPLLTIDQLTEICAGAHIKAQEDGA